jgi:hypothetical protein
MRFKDVVYLKRNRAQKATCRKAKTERLAFIFSKLLHPSVEQQNSPAVTPKAENPPTQDVAHDRDTELTPNPEPTVF